MRIQKLFRFILSLGLLIVFLMHITHVQRISFLAQLENMAYDNLLRLTMPNTQDDQVIIVDIDEKSLSQIGQWPWSRDKLSTIVEQLFERYDIAVLGFDVVFAEPDRSTGLEVLENLTDSYFKNDPDYQNALTQIRPTLAFDQHFANSIKNRPVVMGFYFKEYLNALDESSVGQLPPPVFSLDAQSEGRLPFYEPDGFGANLPILANSAPQGGFFDNPSVDADGIFRRVPLLQIYDNGVYESLSLAVVRHFLGSPPIQMVIGQEASGDSYYEVEALKILDFEIPVDRFATALVPYRGPQFSFPYVSAVDVLNGSADPEILKDKIILVGTTAPGLLDLRSTPIQKAYAGVEVHANLVAGIINQTIKQAPAYLIGYEFILLSLLALLMSLLMPILSPLWASLFSLMLISVVTGFSYVAWQSWNLVVPMASPLALIIMMFILHMSYGFFVESRGKRQLAKMFSQYIPPELVDEMSKRPENYSLDADSREMTVMFSDVRSFTTISENLESTELASLINEFLTPMTKVIHHNRGTIDKYMGDAIMAFWGAPLNDPDNAKHALQAALEMDREMAALRERFKARGWPPINIGIGLNTGVMNVGNMGSEFRMAYTVMGDAVNLGSRLEGLTKQYGVTIIASEFTVAAVNGFVFRELDRVRVKGKEEPVSIYEPLGERHELDESIIKEADIYQHALRRYRQQQWDEAEMQFASLSQKSPQTRLYELYLERIQFFRQNPPEDNWDGVFTFTTK